MHIEGPRLSVQVRKEISVVVLHLTMSSGVAGSVRSIEGADLLVIQKKGKLDQVVETFLRGWPSEKLRSKIGDCMRVVMAIEVG